MVGAIFVIIALAIFAVIVAKDIHQRNKEIEDKKRNHET